MTESEGFLPTTPGTRVEVDDQGEVTFHDPEPDETQAATPEPDESQAAAPEPAPGDEPEAAPEPAEDVTEPPAEEAAPFVPDGQPYWLTEIIQGFHRRLKNLGG